VQISFEATLDDGRKVQVEAEMEGPDESVGLFGWGVDSELGVLDEDGQPVKLTEAEDDRLCQMASKIAGDYESYEP
jgi:hypothetical protein